MPLRAHPAGASPGAPCKVNPSSPLPAAAAPCSAAIAAAGTEPGPPGHDPGARLGPRLPSKPSCAANSVGVGSCESPMRPAAGAGAACARFRLAGPKGLWEPWGPIMPRLPAPPGGGASPGARSASGLCAKSLRPWARTAAEPRLRFSPPNSKLRSTGTAAAPAGSPSCSPLSPGCRSLAGTETGASGGGGPAETGLHDRFHPPGPVRLQPPGAT